MLVVLLWNMTTTDWSSLLLAVIEDGEEEGEGEDDDDDGDGEGGGEGVGGCVPPSGFCCTGWCLHGNSFLPLSNPGPSVAASSGPRPPVLCDGLISLLRSLSLALPSHRASSPRAPSYPSLHTRVCRVVGISHMSQGLGYITHVWVCESGAEAEAKEGALGFLHGEEPLSSQ